MSKVEDDFWNSSSHSGFNFDDEDDSLSVSSENTVFRALTEISSELPIHAVISKTGLNLVLDDVKSTNHILPPVEDPSRRLVKHNYNLHSCVRFTDKIKLLEKAEETCDANVLIKVILYLKETLKTNIFYHQLSKRKCAVKHYGYYLLMKNQLSDLADFYMATGNSSNMKYLYYLTGEGIANKAVLHRKLELFIMEHLQKINSNEDTAELYENLRLIKFQEDNHSSSNSVVTQFAELCKSELSNYKGLEKLQDFKKRFKIDDFTFDWIILNVLASMQLWKHVNEIFIKNNWLTKKNNLKTAIPAEVFLNGLSRHNPPKDVLETFLGCMSDTDTAFALANKFQCHSFIIHYYVNQRDRLALMKYKERVAPQTPDYFLIEGSLQSPENKWKN